MNLLLMLQTAMHGLVKTGLGLEVDNPALTGASPCWHLLLELSYTIVQWLCCYTLFVGCNFGQRPFSYTPPNGFVALNTYNLPTPTISNGANYMAATFTRVMEQLKQLVML